MVFFIDTATPEIYTLSLHEALPISSDRSIKEIVDVLRPQVQELVAKQVELAKTELAPVGKRAGLAAGLLAAAAVFMRSEEHTSELQSRQYLVCRLLLEKNTMTRGQR